MIAELPNYANRFARRGESTGPHLWDGLLGLWYPSLGPTGEKALDWSGYGLDASFQNLTPAEAWVTTHRGHAVKIDAANEQMYTAATSRFQLNGDVPLTIWCDANLIARSGTYGGLVTYRSAVTNGLWALYYAYGGGWFFQFRAANTWYVAAFGAKVLPHDGSIAMTREIGGHYTIFFDGTAFSTDDVATVPVAGTNELCFGCLQQGATTNTLLGEYRAVGIWNRALSPGEIALLYRDPFALLRPRRATRRALLINRVAGPYRTAAGETFHPGPAAAEPFVAGPAAGQTFNTGQTAGATHG